MNRNQFLFISTIASCLFALPCVAQSVYHEPHRPQIHFSPRQKWTNDPNGMVYYNGVYHLFFQYYPDSTVWGPMHWGHATSKDLVHWKQQPIALYPDSLGYIFSGSAVVDKNNTSGFGAKGQVPLVAIFTHHDPVGARAHKNNFQNQSLAYSLDGGKTWKKFAGNPVLKNPGVTDFRDPKVMWYEPQKKWIMTLATKDRVTFYSSPNLKDWTRESDFGKDAGAHGGVWECPDLFSLNDGSKKMWVLIVNVNPGGPNGGSATQYFLGDFDGHTFNPSNTDTRWLDYGPDEYAGITWSNTGNRKIFLGWMSNWLYANVVPTTNWRNAMTIPRELYIRHEGNDMMVASRPVPELKLIQSPGFTTENIAAGKDVELSEKAVQPALPGRIELSLDEAADFSVILSNKAGENVVIGFDKQQNNYFIDRSRSGITGFQKNFAGRHIAPRFAKGEKMNLSLVIDVSSVELFADEGATVMTSIFFPNQPFNSIHVKSPEKTSIKKLSYYKLRGIW